MRSALLRLLSPAISLFTFGVLKGEKKHINKPLLNEPSFIVIDFYRTLNGINKQTNKTGGIDRSLAVPATKYRSHSSSVDKSSGPFLN